VRRAREFGRMRAAGPWTKREPLLAAAALAPAGGQHGTWLQAAEDMLGELPPEEAVPARLAAAQVRLAVSRRTGDLEALDAAVAETGAMLEAVPAGVLARCPWIEAQTLSGRGTPELWSGQLGEAAATFEAAAAPGPRPGRHPEAAGCLGYAALPHAPPGPPDR